MNRGFTLALGLLALAACDAPAASPAAARTEAAAPAPRWELPGRYQLDLARRSEFELRPNLFPPAERDALLTQLGQVVVTLEEKTLRVDSPPALGLRAGPFPWRFRVKSDDEGVLAVGGLPTPAPPLGEVAYLAIERKGPTWWLRWEGNRVAIRRP